MKIKCGRREYELKDGDYILDNGNCYQFIPKDKTVLQFRKWNYVTPRVSKKEFQRIMTLPNIIKKKDEMADWCLCYIWKDIK